MTRDLHLLLSYSITDLDEDHLFMSPTTKTHSPHSIVVHLIAPHLLYRNRRLVKNRALDLSRLDPESPYWKGTRPREVWEIADELRQRVETEKLTIRLNLSDAELQHLRDQLEALKLPM